MYHSERNGIYFVEGSIPGAQHIGPISTELNDFFGENQLKSLDDLKDRMAIFIKSSGGNAVLNFKYGQRSTFWKSFFGMDDVFWYGSGDIAKINGEDLH